MNTQVNIKPQIALVLHGVNSNSLSVVTKHEITEKGMGLGSYIEPEELKNVLDGRLQEVEVSRNVELLPRNLLLDNAEQMVWYTPSHTGFLWYRYQNKEIQLPITYPALLFKVKKGKRPQLQLFALDSDDYPTCNSKLYNAPFMNVGVGGDVCQGTAELPKKINATEVCLKAIESTVFDSYFTHVNNNTTLKSDTSVTTEQLLRFWQKKSKAKKSIKPSEMVYKCELADVLSR